jgi:hypothetical protein
MSFASKSQIVVKATCLYHKGTGSFHEVVAFYLVRRVGFFQDATPDHRWKGGIVVHRWGRVALEDRPTDAEVMSLPPPGGRILIKPVSCDSHDVIETIATKKSVDGYAERRVHDGEHHHDYERKRPKLFSPDDFAGHYNVAQRNKIAQRLYKEITRIDPDVKALDIAVYLGAVWETYNDDVMRDAEKEAARRKESQASTRMRIEVEHGPDWGSWGY